MTDHEHSLDATEGPDWIRIAREIAEGQAAASAPAAAAGADPRATLVAALATTLRASHPQPPTDAEVELALASVLARRQESAPRTSAEPAPRRIRPALAWATAAAVLITAGALVVSRRGAPEGAARPVQTLATRVGQVDSLRLPDGSLVVLGPASSIERSGDFSKGTREVTLRGDAFFDVVHDAVHPFIVRTSRGELRDVGTSFVVRSDGPDGLMVSVRTGVVALRRTGADVATEARLAAGDRATVPEHGEVSVERGTGSESDAAFTRGRLVLENSPVAEVADAMRRWYGLDFRVIDAALLGRRVTATFERESGPDAARIVAAVMGGTARIAGDTVLVSGPVTGSPTR